jgi:hypothetical protein
MLWAEEEVAVINFLVETLPNILGGFSLQLFKCSDIGKTGETLKQLL